MLNKQKWDYAFILISNFIEKKDKEQSVMSKLLKDVIRWWQAIVRCMSFSRIGNLCLN